MLCGEYCPSLKQLLEIVLVVRNSKYLKEKMKEYVILKQLNTCFPGTHPYKNIAVLVFISSDVGRVIRKSYAF